MYQIVPRAQRDCFSTAFNAALHLPKKPSNEQSDRHSAAVHRIINVRQSIAKSAALDSTVPTAYRIPPASSSPTAAKDNPRFPICSLRLEQPLSRDRTKATPFSNVGVNSGIGVGWQGGGSGSGFGGGGLGGAGFGGPGAFYPGAYQPVSGTGGYPYNGLGYPYGGYPYGGQFLGNTYQATRFGGGTDPFGLRPGIDCRICPVGLPYWAGFFNQRAKRDTTPAESAKPKSRKKRLGLPGVSQCVSFPSCVTYSKRSKRTFGLRSSCIECEPGYQSAAARNKRSFSSGSCTPFPACRTKRDATRRSRPKRTFGSNCQVCIAK
uniref:Uncharacterized protein n=1 Tax=Plectus sambesii TaxID=2011161 RepID=A0A914W551_9BILA